jgi:hypothetical protein
MIQEKLTSGITDFNTLYGMDIFMSYYHPSSYSLIHSPTLGVCHGLASLRWLIEVVPKADKSRNQERTSEK